MYLKYTLVFNMAHTLLKIIEEEGFMACIAYHPSLYTINGWAMTAITLWQRAHSICMRNADSTGTKKRTFLLLYIHHTHMHKIISYFRFPFRLEIRLKYTHWTSKSSLTIATAKPMTVMMPKGTSTIPIPEPSITASGNVVALKLVSFVVIVTVINVVLEVTLSLGVVERKGVTLVEDVGDVERRVVVVLAAVAAMIRCDWFELKDVFSLWMNVVPLC